MQQFRGILRKLVSESASHLRDDNTLVETFAHEGMIRVLCDCVDMGRLFEEVSALVGLDDILAVQPVDDTIRIHCNKNRPNVRLQKENVRIHSWQIFCNMSNFGCKMSTNRGQ